MIFKKLTIETKPILEHYLEENEILRNYYGSELNFQNLAVWRETDQVEVAEVANKYLLLRAFNSGMFCYFPPIARNWDDFIEAVQWMEANSVDANIPFLIRSLSEEMAMVLQKTTMKYRIAEDRNMFEYLYSSKDLRTLSGKKFHNKRNLVNQFEKQNQFIFKPYEDSDLPLIQALLSRWEEHKSHAFEHKAIIETLRTLDQLGCFADVLLIDGEAVAFAIGTKNEKMGLVLFEKANTDFTGVYAAINMLFANRHFEDVEIINRQEDLGISELRKAKLSYNPLGFAKKYNLTRNHLTLQEVNELKALYHEAFDDSEGFLEYFFQQKFRAENVIFHKNDHKIVSALHFIPKTLSIHERLFACPFVVAAATLKAFRRQGIMYSLLHQAMFDLYNRNLSLVGLSPFSETFYAKTGFVTVNRSDSMVINIPENNRFTYQNIGENDLGLLDEIYREKMLSFNVFIDRSIAYWQGFFAEVMSDDGKIILVKEQGKAIGYFTCFGDSSEEICFLDDSKIALVDRLDKVRLLMLSPQGSNSHAMIRILNVKKLLSEFPFSKDTNLVKRIKITDTFFELNNVILELTVHDGIPSIRDIEEFDEEVSIETLTSMLFLTGNEIFPKPKALIFDKY